jgi:hypothetical protein
MTAAADRFRLTAPEPSERELHEAVADALNALLLDPAFWCAYPAGVVQLSPQQAAAYSRFGLKTGMPDILIWWKGIWIVELKRRGGQLSRTRIVKTKHGALREIVGQVERFEQLCKTGAVRDLSVCYSVDDVLNQLGVWGIPLRGRIAA